MIIVNKSFHKRKNILDIEERNNRTYFNTALIIGFTFFTALLTISTVPNVYNNFSSIIAFSYVIAFTMIVIAFRIFKRKADEKFEQIKKLR